MPTGGTFSGTSTTWDFISDTVAKNEQILVGEGLRGYRQRQINAERAGLYDVAGQLTCNPSIGFLSYWLPYVMGSGTSTAPTFAAAVPAFDMIADRADGVYKYTGCKINRFELKFASGQLATCTMDVIGKTETAVSWAGAALGSSMLYDPLQSAECQFETTGGVRAVEELSFGISNGLAPKRRMNLTVQDILEGDREVFLRGKATMDSAELGALYDIGGSPDNGVILTLTNTQGLSTVSATFTFSRVRFPSRTGIPEGEEFMLPFDALCRGVAAGVEFTASLDITP